MKRGTFLMGFESVCEVEASFPSLPTRLTGMYLTKEKTKGRETVIVLCDSLKEKN